MENQIEIYKSSDNAIELQVSLDNDTVWLNRNQLAVLFDRDIKTIGKHINTIFEEEELVFEATVAKFATVQKKKHLKSYKLYKQLEIYLKQNN